jgi:hypothetical protein
VKLLQIAIAAAAGPNQLLPSACVCLQDANLVTLFNNLTQMQTEKKGAEAAKARAEEAKVCAASEHDRNVKEMLFHCVQRMHVSAAPCTSVCNGFQFTQCTCDWQCRAAVPR